MVPDIPDEFLWLRVTIVLVFSVVLIHVVEVHEGIALVSLIVERMETYGYPADDLRIEMELISDQTPLFIPDLEFSFYNS